MHENNNIEQLLSDYCIGRISKEAGNKLRRWIDESAENRQEAIRFISTYRKGRALQFMDEYSADRVMESITKQLGQRKRHRLVTRWLSAAASIILVLSIATLFNLFRDQSIDKRLAEEGTKTPWNYKATLTLEDGEVLTLSKDSVYELKDQLLEVHHQEDKGIEYHLQDRELSDSLIYHTLHVPRGGMFSTTLSDGTVVWLNAGSELLYPIEFTRNTREVYLTGEAYFEVSKNKDKPFVVHAHGVLTKVLGTAFNVNAYEADIIAVTLEEGKVEVSNRSGSAMLDPGMQAAVINNEGSISTKNVITSHFTSWRNGIFSFDDITLEELCVKLSRWYDVDFKFEDEALKNKRLNGAVLREKDLNFILHVIELTSEIEFEINKENTISIK